ALKLAVNQIKVQPNGNLGGVIDIVDGSISYPGMSNNQPLILDAIGPNNAASVGGSVTVMQKSALTAGLGGGNIEAKVFPQGSNNGGGIQLFSFSNLTVDANGLVTNPSANANLSSNIHLDCNKNLLVTNMTSFTAGLNGNIHLSSNSPTPMTV